MDFEQANWKQEKINVKKMLLDTCKKLNIHAKNKNIEIHMGNIPDDMNIKFDKDGFEQIILNIAGNAIKYTQDYGNVWVSANKENKNIIISIKDDGIGIPKEDINRIFDRFYRVDKARTREMGGTGLGLSIAKQIAESHNSKLLVESEVQKGTEIKIIIPEYEVYEVFEV
jgi:two-component system sensor histidine kinase VicK